MEVDGSQNGEADAAAAAEAAAAEAAAAELAAAEAAVAAWRGALEEAVAQFDASVDHKRLRGADISLRVDLNGDAIAAGAVPAAAERPRARARRTQPRDRAAEGGGAPALVRW